MSSESWYVRTRGRVSGPFTADALQELVRRRQLTRFSELSEDRVIWRAANTLSWLFQRMAPEVHRQDAAVEVAEAGLVATPEGAPAATGVASPNSGYLYVQNGEEIGPIPLNAVKSLVKVGTIQADTVVWPVGAAMAVPARQLPELAVLFTGSAPAQISERTVPAAIRVTTITALCTSVGISAGVLAFLCYWLPIAAVRTQLIGWWTLLGSSEPRGQFLLLVFAVVTAGTLVAPIALRGHSRGIVQISLFAAAVAALFLALVPVMLFMPTTVVMVLATPVACAFVAAASLAMLTDPSALKQRIWTGVLGGLCSLGSFTSLALLTSSSDATPLGWADVIVTLVTLGMLASGILAIIASALGGVKTAKATCICSVASFGVVGLSGIVAAIVVSDVGRFAGSSLPGGVLSLAEVSTLIVARIILSPLALSLSAALGLLELLTANSVGAPSLGPPVSTTGPSRKHPRIGPSKGLGTWQGYLLVGGGAVALALIVVGWLVWSSPGRLSPEKIFAATRPAVVVVVTSAGQGSAFFVRSDGLAVTNHHVVESGGQISLHLHDGTIVSARLIISDPDQDLALLKVSQGEPFTILSLGESMPAVGSTVYAIGNPMGLEATLSTGIVSGIRSADDAGFALIQNTAAISGGSSGGPLIDDAGRVVGVTTLATISPELQSVYFAVPARQVRDLMERARKNGLLTDE